MKLEIYQQIIDIVRSHKCSEKEKCLQSLTERFIGFQLITFRSIYSQELRRKILANIKKHRRPDVASKYYERCMTHLEKNREAGVILQIAEKADLPPVLIARVVIHEYLKNTKFKEFGSVPKSHVSQCLKNLQLIPDERLASEIQLCIEKDDDCSPASDIYRQKLGQDYEEKLKNKLVEKDIPFLDEDRLRDLGYDKTPDFKLEVPIALAGFVVNWIESKASFGDEESHATFLNEQYWSYTNRFGSGMVIYWFGFIDELDNNKNRGIILYDKLPDEITTLDMLLV